MSPEAPSLGDVRDALQALNAEGEKYVKSADVAAELDANQHRIKNLLSEGNQRGWVSVWSYGTGPATWTIHPGNIPDGDVQMSTRDGSSSQVCPMCGESEFAKLAYHLADDCTGAGGMSA